MKEKLFNLIRKYLIIYFTGNLGKVIETDDKIICYVKESKGKKGYGDRIIHCSGISSEEQELAQAYHINKPIYYIFDNLDFDDKHIYIWGYDNCGVIIKDCKFKYGLTIHVTGDCIIDNDYIDSFINQISISATNLVLKNLTFNNKYKIVGEKLQIFIGADKNLDIIDSEIGKLNEKTSIAIFSSDKMKIANSKINGSVVKCGAINFEMDEISEVGATNLVDIKAEEFDKIKVKAPKVICNDRIFNKKDDNIFLKKINNDLESKRNSLIELLKKIKDECDKANVSELSDYKNSLFNKSISRVLKK